MYARIFSLAHILAWAVLGFLFEAFWYITTHHHAPLWARLCGGFAAGALAGPIETALARRHARRRTRVRRPGRTHALCDPNRLPYISRSGTLVNTERVKQAPAPDTTNTRHEESDS